MTLAKSVLITGASRGIGRALCQEALKRGYTVHALVRDANTAPPGTTVHVADIRETEKVEKILTELAPVLTHYIANAGVDAPFSPKDEAYAEKAAAVFEINGTATAFSLYRLAHEWIKQSAQDRHIALVSSLAAGRGYPRSGVYVATKTAQLSLAQALSFDLKRFGIAVSVIQPGFVETELSRKQPLRPFLMNTERAAQIIWDGIECKRFRIAFPWPTRVLAWLPQAVPYFIFSRMVSFMQKRKWM